MLSSVQTDLQRNLGRPSENGQTKTREMECLRYFLLVNVLRWADLRPGRRVRSL